MTTHYRQKAADVARHIKGQWWYGANTKEDASHLFTAVLSLCVFLHHHAKHPVHFSDHAQKDFKMLLVYIS